MAKKFRKKQPKKGEIVLHCGHLKQNAKWHCFRQVGGFIYFVRPDRTQGKSKWIVCCMTCFEETKGQGDKVRLTGEMTWATDEPSVYVEE